MHKEELHLKFVNDANLSILYSSRFSIQNKNLFIFFILFNPTIKLKYIYDVFQSMLKFDRDSIGSCFNHAHICKSIILAEEKKRKLK